MTENRAQVNKIKRISVLFLVLFLEGVFSFVFRLTHRTRAFTMPSKESNGGKMERTLGQKDSDSFRYSHFLNKAC